MERVQYHQEQMLPELKDLVKKGIFSPAETREIIKRRTHFETAMVRRVADKADFLRYVQYEMALETLRRKRLQRLKLRSSGSSVSDYAMIRRQYYILERAVRKFKADVTLWTQYIELAKQNGARALVSRLCARALQLHPESPPLYILAASHELSQGAPSSARTLLQRGLRFNSNSVELWTEYVKMELTYLEGLRRRWDVLGIQDIDSKQLQAETSQASLARQQVLEGAVVRAVIDSAAKSLPTWSLFESLHRLLRSYPSSLVSDLMTYLLERMKDTRPSDPKAIVTWAIELVDNTLQGALLIDHVKFANETILQALPLGEETLSVYRRWVEGLVGKLQGSNAELVEYIQLSLRKASHSRKQKC